MKKITVNSKKEKQVINITSDIEKVLPSDSGVCTIFLSHTTASITTADLDPGTDLDMLDAFNELVPELKFRHPHDPSHVEDHILSSLIGTSLIVPYQNSSLILGTWQNVVLIEFNGPRKRTLVLNILK
ncbi:YjbQ family protein [Candidatus Dojkabacteria bacterium]|nr:YjbQ family protein [Candidatus Dojkabacteria bacterium]